MLPKLIVWTVPLDLAYWVLLIAFRDRLPRFLTAPIPALRRRRRAARTSNRSPR